MEGFDSNPFDETNPFADSSVSQARKVTNEREAQLDNYNPFAKDQFAQQQPAVIQPSETQSSTFTPLTSANNAAAGVTSLTIQQEELERRAAELDKRERDLNARVAVVENPNNFPPLPSCCPLKPCFVQDINVDIPQPFQLVVKLHFYIWLAYYILMLLNLAGSLAYMIASYDTNSGTTFGLSIFYFLIFPPLSYVVWFRAIYKAFKNDSSLNYFLYFIVFFVHNCINIFWCIGVPGSGAVGFISGLTMLKTNSGVGAFMIIIGILFGGIGGIGMFFIIRVLRFYRNMDASFKKAQEELAGGVLSNRGVQQAVFDTAASSMNEPSRF